MTMDEIREILKQAKEVDTVEWIYFEGGEPFLYYPVLLKGVALSAEMGYKVGVVTNGYWATSRDDAREWLTPLVGKIQDLSISSDLYHYDEKRSLEVRNVCAAAEELKIPLGVISVAQPEDASTSQTGKLPEGDSSVMYRGRAVEKLAPRAAPKSWDTFNECTCEDLREPGRLHVDPLGYAHICQGISLGNLFQASLKEICESYEPDSHPIIGPLLEGGPAELVRRYDLPHLDFYADACHLCYEARYLLRERFPAILGPGQMYGVED
jgi:MoaA/NifB/PqqE/SkfB family radical SAM enzyme